jgi:hypothetical protein
MKRKGLVFINIYIVLFLLLVTNIHPAVANDQKGLQGWEAGSEYNNLYNARELDKIKGHITKFIEVTPLAGMDTGTAFLLDEGDGEPITVHLCPAAYATAKATGLRKGVASKLKGSWAVIDDKDVFLASKIKQGEHFEFKVRLTKDGTPFWTLSPEEIARELASE